MRPPEGTPRFYLSGRLAIEGSRVGSRVVDQAELPGRQGRLAFVRLVAERHRPVPLSELAEALWGQRLPASWEASLRVVVSKLRTALAAADPDLAIASDAGCYQAVLGGAWVDLEAAANAVDRAEGAWRNRDRATAWAEASVATVIGRRPILPGEDLPWVGELRGRSRTLLVRALSVLAEVHLAEGTARLAVETARELVALEPYREAGHRQLMRAEAAAGDRAEALRVHDRLRRALAEELGVAPSPETEAVHLALLRDGHLAGADDPPLASRA